MKSLITCSKFLSKVLRHEPSLAGVELGEGGWVLISDLLQGCDRAGVPMTLDQLHEVVDTNDKKRFAISDDGNYIRASQGHSVEVDLQYDEKLPPDYLYHGTVDRFLPEIMESGLKKMSRHHVHLSLDIETALRVAGRRREPVALLQVSSGVMSAKGFAFFQSANGVWLTDAVPPEYLTEVDERGNVYA